MSIAIIGLGQIGSSLGSALVARRLDARVIGIARRRDTVRRALAMRAAHETTTDLAAAREADVVVLATPVRSIIALLPHVAHLLKPGAMVTDVGSTKSDVLKAAKGVPFIGGHPMAGTETAGLDGCDKHLFAGRPWILIPAHGVLPSHVTRIGRLVAGVGAKPTWLKSAAAHDAAIAAASHVPHLLAYALLASVDDRTFAGGSFRDATRVAASSPDMVIDFLLTNRRPVARAMSALGRHIAKLVAAVRKGDERTLRKLIEAARRK